MEGWKTLVIDDHPSWRRAIRALLAKDARFGEVHEAGGLEDGSALMRSRTWDLVIIDLGLGEDDGMGLLSERGRSSCVVMSAEGGREMEAVRSGARSFALKSTPADQLLALLVQACQEQCLDHL